MPRKYNAQESIERIISVSLKLFKEKGFDKTSMQDIVSATEMSKGAIFYHFKSKEDIFNAAMERDFELAKKRFYQLLAELDDHTAKQKMECLLRANFADLEINSAVYSMVVIASASPHLVLANMRKNLKEVAPIIAALIKEGVADGSITTDFADEWAEVFTLLYNHWCDMFIFPCDLPTVRRRLKFLQHLTKQAGCDIISDQVIDLNMTLMESIYKEVQNG